MKRASIPRWLRIVAAALGVCGLASSAIAADDDASVRADQMKAAYVFNFVKFVEWPADALGDAIRICFVGAPSVADSLRSATANKQVGARRIVSRTLARGEAPAGCAVVYFDAQVIGEEVATLHSARTAALTISDAQSFTRSGGAIQLFTEENRLRFVINVGNARRAGVRISSNLLKLASNVEQDGAP